MSKCSPMPAMSVCDRRLSIHPARGDLPAGRQLDTSRTRTLNHQDACALEHDSDPAGSSPPQERLQVLVQAAGLAICRIQAANRYPAPSAQKLRDSLHGAPGQRCPGFLLTEKEHQPIGGIALNLETPAASGSG